MAAFLDPAEAVTKHPAGSGLLSRQSDATRIHDWAEDHKPDHIGGTMRPAQSIPEFSPYYVEFSEDFGGYNFGTGNAQLDFKDLKFDWACRRTAANRMPPPLIASRQSA